MPKPVILFDYMERKKKHGTIEIELGDGQPPISVPPTELWRDEAFDTAGTGDTKGALAIILGQEAADRFTAAGGNWRMLNGIVVEQRGVSVGESAASSES